MAAAEEVTGYTDLERQDDGTVMATAHYADGHTKRCSVRVSVEREHRCADGELVAAGEIASTDDGSLRFEDGASL